MAVVAALVGSLLGLSAPAVPAGAAPQELELTMVPGGGTLRLRDSEEAAPLASPTTLTGTLDDATGALTGGVFSTPPVHYEFDITDPLPGRVFVDATFSALGEAPVTGSLDDEDNLTIEMMVKADLNVVVRDRLGGQVISAPRCTVQPIPLRLLSTAPYDREGTKQVTLRDDDFTVPEVPDDPANCHELVAGGVNERLMGSGHAIELRMQGEIPEVKGKGEPTTTALAVEPDVSRAGEPVVVSATVTQADGDPEVPTGTVEFRDGTVVIGSAALDGTGTAVLTAPNPGSGVSALAVGEHSLSARFLGDGELYQASRSAPVAHLVAAAPTVDVTMGDAAQIGGGPVSAKVVVTNPEEFGADLVNARVDLLLRRTLGSGDFTPARVVVEWLDGGTWEALPLSAPTSSTVGASIGLPRGFRLDAGSVHEFRLRVRFPAVGTGTTQCDLDSRTCPGPAELSATLNEVDAGDGTIRAARASGLSVFTMVEATRRDTTLSIVGNLPRPHSVRGGYSLEVIASIGPNLNGVRPSGFAELYIDGLLTPARRVVDPVGEYFDRVAIGTAIQGVALLPPDIDPEPHVLTVCYLGDKVFKPAEVTTTFTVFPPVEGSAFFVCQVDTLSGKHEVGANVVFDATVPSTALSGAPVELDIASAVINMNRAGTGNPWPGIVNNGTVAVGTPTLQGITFDFGEAGTGSAASVTRTGGTAQAPSPNPVTDLSQLDQKMTLNDPTGSVTVAGEPGDVVPVTLEGIVFDFNLVSPPLAYQGICTPRDGEPVELGEVEIAGTEVSVSPDPAREGTDEMTIAARTHPSDAAGTVSFSSSRDGSLGEPVEVVDGVASVVTSELSPGVHTITALFNATDPDVPDTIGTATVRVSYSPRTDTEPFVVAARTDFLGSADADDVVADAEALDGGLSRVTYLRQLARSAEYLARVVEDLYQDTLGRPADEAGRAFWIDRLRNGWSVARVTAIFYGSGEYFTKAGGGALESWVDDLYGKLLGRSSDSSGRAYWVGEANRVGRGSVALRFFQSRESARARVIALYEHFLGRTPGAAEWGFWVPRVISQGDLALAVELANSGEYVRKAEVRFPVI